MCSCIAGGLFTTEPLGKPIKPWLLLLFSHPVVSNSLWPHVLQYARPPCPSPSPEVCPSSCPLHRWCHPIISSFYFLFSCRPQSFSASGTFPTSWPFTSGDQSTGASASASVLPVSIQGWFPLRLTDLISLSNQESSQALQFKVINSLLLCFLYGPALTTTHDHWEDHGLDYTDLSQQSNVSAFQHTV